MAAETESTCSQATEHQQAGTPIIETASATTSADNANSGSKPYVIAAAVSYTHLTLPTTSRV